MKGRVIISSEFSRRTLSVTNILIYVQKLDQWLFIHDTSILYSHYQVFGLYRAEVYYHANFLNDSERIQLQEFCSALHPLSPSESSSESSPISYLLRRFINVSFDFPGKEEYSLDLSSKELDEEKYSISPSKTGHSPISRCSSRNNVRDSLQLMTRFTSTFYGIHGYRYEFLNLVYKTDQIVFPTGNYELLTFDDALMKLNPIDKGIMKQASVLMQTKLSTPMDNCETSKSLDERDH